MDTTTTATLLSERNAKSIAGFLRYEADRPDQGQRKLMLDAADLIDALSAKVETLREELERMSEGACEFDRENDRLKKEVEALTKERDNLMAYAKHERDLGYEAGYNAAQAERDRLSAENAAMREALGLISGEWFWSPIIEDSPNSQTANRIICQMQTIATAALSAPAPTWQAGELARELAEALNSLADTYEAMSLDDYPGGFSPGDDEAYDRAQAALTKARAAGLLPTDTTTTTKEGAQADATSRQAAQGE